MEQDGAKHDVGYMGRDLREGLENTPFNRGDKIFFIDEYTGEWQSVKDVNLCVEGMARNMTYTYVGVPGHKSIESAH